MRTSKDSLLELIRNSGLEVKSVQGNDPGPTVETAWRAMAGFGVEPKASVPLKGDLREVHGLWLDYARQGNVIADDGTFLVTAVVTGSSEIGWVLVRLTDTTDVSRLIDDQGRIEFISRSTSGRHICGVTAEEYDYWIIALDL
ncbi:hypothetical protein WDV06_31900 [Streptomyces racemochromogenes]|uniref:Uncharacterized protein n=1 Tax=Streptomyces racemochromogenes TaxID=67353 RepID=A0ABW7PMZ6_9ACTN